MCKVSVIIPIYNTEIYLRECLDSVINQTFKDIEIILVNTGSTNNCLSICLEYQRIDSRIVVIDQKNSNISVARNEGLKKSKGEYLIFLDSDDVFHSQFIEKLYREATKMDSDIVICRENRFAVKEFVLPIEWLIDSGIIPYKQNLSIKNYKNYIFNFCVLWSWDKLYRRDFLLKNNILFPTNKELQPFEDLVFVAITLACAKQIHILKEYLINHRYHEKFSEPNCSSNSVILALRTLKNELLTRNLYEKTQKSFINIALSYLYWHYSNSKDNQKIVFQEIKNNWIKEFAIDTKLAKFFYNKYEYQKFSEKFVEKNKINKIFDIYKANKIDFYTNRIILRLFFIKIKFKFNLTNYQYYFNRLDGYLPSYQKNGKPQSYKFMILTGFNCSLAFNKKREHSCLDSGILNWAHVQDYNSLLKFLYCPENLSKAKYQYLKDIDMYKPDGYNILFHSKFKYAELYDKNVDTFDENIQKSIEYVEQRNIYLIDKLKKQLLSDEKKLIIHALYIDKYFDKHLYKAINFINSMYELINKNYKNIDLLIICEKAYWYKLRNKINPNVYLRYVKRHAPIGPKATESEYQDLKNYKKIFKEFSMDFPTDNENEIQINTESKKENN